MKHSLLFSTGGLFLLLLIFFSACDEISAPTQSDSVSIESLGISPDTIEFDSDSPIGDQEIPVTLILTLKESSESDFRYTVERRGMLVSEGRFNHHSGAEYIAEFILSVNSVNNLNFTVYAFSDEHSAGERMQGSITVRGREVSPPVIEDAYNTEEAAIPEAGNERIDFFARVVHPDNQEFIDRVNFFLIDQQGNQLGDNFEMFDDGVFNESEGLIDEAAGDSLYSRAFFINPTNNPDEVTVFYFAVGVDGQSSDTLQTELRIVE